MAIERRKSPEMVAVLDPLYVMENTAHEEAHVQEHIFERRQHYKQMRDFFDCLNRLARCRRRKLLNRIVVLDGTPSSRFEDVKTFDDIKPAVERAHETHKRMFGEYETAIDSAFAKKDHKSHKILVMNQVKIDCILSVLEAVYEQADDLKTNFLLLAIKRLPKP